MEQKKQIRKRKHRKSDILWKVVMEEVFADLLRFVYPDADQVYDMERGFEFLDLFDNPEMNLKFDEEFKQHDKYDTMNMEEYIRMEARKEGRREGRVEGREKGREETQVAVVKNLIETTEFSDNRIAAIVGVSVSFVKGIRKEKKKVAL